MEPLVKWKLLTHIAAISSVPLINQKAVGKGEGMSFGLFVHVFLSYFHLLSKMKETLCVCTRACHLDMLLVAPAYVSMSIITFPRWIYVSRT